MVLIACLVLGTSHHADAGNSSTGGGYLRTYWQNPWLLQNTTEATYCLQIDPQNFGVSKGVARQQIRAAFAYWKAIYKKEVGLGGIGRHKFQIASQAFHEIECNGTQDITFKLGTLSKKEKRNYIENPKQVIAAAVLTGYDRKSLRGRGFVYISPETGPLAPNRKNIVERRWQIGGHKLLLLNLIHELGHVFGLAHAGQAPSLMAEDFSEFSTSKTSDFQPRFAGFLKALGLPKSLFRFRESAYSFCSDFLELPTTPLTGVPKDYKCFQMRKSAADVWELWARPSAKEKWERFGIFDFSQTIAGFSTTQRELYLFLPEEQNVYPGLSGSVLVNPYLALNTKTSGLYRSGDGTVQSFVILEKSPGVGLMLHMQRPNNPIELGVLFFPSGGYEQE